MTTPAVSVTPSTSFREIVQLMAQHRVSAVPVVEADGRLVGLISEADLLLKEETPLWAPFFEWSMPPPPPEGDAQRRADATVAGQLMSSPVVVIHRHALLGLAARMMRHHGVRRLCVVDDQNRLVGVVSRSDLLTAFLRSDAEIRHDIVGMGIQQGLWRNTAAIQVEVVDGVVTLVGEVERDKDAALAAELARRIDGVVAVDSRLTSGPVSPSRA